MKLKIFDFCIPLTSTPAASAPNTTVSAWVVPPDIMRGGSAPWATAIDNLDFIKAGDLVVAPVVPVPTTITMRANITGEIAAARLSEAARLDGVPNSQQVSTPQQLARLPNPASGDAAACRTPPRGEIWPLPFDALTAQLRRNNELRARQGPATAKDVVVMVLDTGFDFRGIEPGFPSRAFARMEPLQEVSSTGAIMVRDWHTNGLNFASTRKNSSETKGSFLSQGRDMTWHGAAVISAALGSRAYDSRRPDGFPWILPASSVNYESTSPTMIADALINAIKFAAAPSRDISVMNFSATIENDPNIQPHMQTNSNLTLVAAAGNDGPNQSLHWPAKLGGDIANLRGLGTVVTVGGHEPDGRVWPSSNVSDSMVDLLAPACDVPVHEGSQDATGRKKPVAAVLAGTSFAAPLVSLIAGLLAKEAVPASEIKIRLNQTARLTPEAWRTTYSGGLLDAVAALSIYEDFLRYIGDDGVEREAFGSLADRQGILHVCGRDWLADKVKGVGVVEVAGIRRVRAWTKDHLDENVKRTSCLESESNIKIEFDPSNGTPRITVGSARLISFAARR